MADIHPVTLPKWGLEMSEGLVSKWLVAEGADIEPGAELVDIETDKIVNTLDIDKGGVLRRILVPEGETVSVGTLIAVLAPADVPDADVAAFVDSYVPIDASFEPKDDTDPAQSQAPAVPETEAKSVKATPLARRAAEQQGLDLSEIQGSGGRGKIRKADLPPANLSLSNEEIKAQNAEVYASPIAVNFANEIGLDLTDVAPSGYKGRVSLTDAQAAAEAAGLWQEPYPSAAEIASVARTAERRSVAGAVTETPFTGMRKSIARALTQSKQTIPHFYTAMDVQMDALMALRARFNADRGDAPRISVNDLLLRASALALRDSPDVNIHVSETGVTQFDQVDLCVAVAIDGGLITPVIRDAAALSLTEITSEAARLIAAARDRSLSADDLRGGTFTLSNLGMYGVRSFDAIINPPQGAILSVGGPRREARECPEKGVRFASVVTVTLSADHRGIDGAVAAQFLSHLKGRLEAPMSLLM